MYRITRVALDSYVTYNFDDNRADRPSGDGQTMAEALAALWLKLRVAE
jgi:hypothetical protein